METKTTKNQCFECRNGEHEDYDSDIRLIVAKDPDTGRIYRRGKLCSEHRAAYSDDGYKVIYQ